MIATYREDFIEEEELYDDFNAYGLPVRPRIHRGIARPYGHKRRINRGGVHPKSRPKRRKPIKVSKNILIPRKKAIKFGEPRRVKLPIKKSPILKVSPTKALSKNKEKASTAQRASVRSNTKAKANAKALKEEVTQNGNARATIKEKSSKTLMVAFIITTTVFVGYVIWQERKKMKQ